MTHDPLMTLLSTGKVPHALLVVHGKEPALRCARALLGAKETTAHHPDLHELMPDSKSGFHLLDDLRQMMSQAALYPLQGQRKVFVLHDAHRMQVTSANALLKILEEPVVGTYFLLLTSTQHAILPTLRSRCRLVVYPTPPLIALPAEQLVECLALRAPFQLIEDYVGTSWESLQAVLEMTVKIARDQWLLRQPWGEPYLFFPHLRTQIAALPLPSMTSLMQQITIAQTAFERHMKVTTIMHFLCSREVELFSYRGITRVPAVSITS